MIDQLSVFLGNEKGRLTALCEALGEANIQMHALTVADTSDYGVVRIICDAPEKARDTLADKGFKANLVKVVAVQVPDVPGGVAKVFETIEAAGFSVEYAYCFAASEGKATLAVKIDGDVRQALADATLKLIHPEDLYTV